MGRRGTVFDLGRLALSSGEGRRIDLEVGVDPFEFGGQHYRVEGRFVDARVEVSRTTSGYALRLRYRTTLVGPCTRCLEDAGQALSIDAREIDQPGGVEDLSSPYVDGVELDLHAWVRDALALALPSRIVCREECLGLCAVCGENLNQAPPGHSHGREPDPRWRILDELRLE